MRAAASLLLIAAGCASWLSAPVPMPTTSHRADPQQRAKCALILLPGRGDTREDFVEHNWLDAIRRRHLAVDVITAEATLGYYAQGSIRTRLEADVLAPIRAMHYDEVWVAGVSMGGMGALSLALEHAKDLTGIVLMAPWLGETDIQEEIERAGGLAKWKPGAVAPDDYQRRVWAWLQTATATPDAKPQIYLAAGNLDKLGRGHRLLAPLLPRDRVFRTAGDHDWGPWGRLWNEFLDRSDFKTHCGG